MTIDEMQDFMDRVVEDPHPCCYGHRRCSDSHRGPCSDEAWSSRCSDESAEDYADRLGLEVAEGDQ